MLTKFNGLILKQIYKTSDYATMRGLEHLTFLEFKPPLNIINPISPLNKNKEAYLKAALDFMKKGNK